jgi:hypothetical protein
MNTWAIILPTNVPKLNAFFVFQQLFTFQSVLAHYNNNFCSEQLQAWIGGEEYTFLTADFDVFDVYNKHAC